MEGFKKVDWRPLVRRVHEHEEGYIKSHDIRQPVIGVDIINLDTSSEEEEEENDDEDEDDEDEDDEDEEGDDEDTNF